MISHRQHAGVRLPLWPLTLVSCLRYHRPQGHPAVPASTRVRDLLPLLAVLPGLAVVTALLLSARLIADRLAPQEVKPQSSPRFTGTTSIVVAVESGGEALRRCLHSVAEAIRTNGTSLEVIVVGANSDSAEIWAELPTVRFLPGRVAGLVEKWQLGILAAIGETVIPLCDTATVDGGFLLPLLAGLEDERTFATVPICEEPAQGDSPDRTAGFRGDLHNGELRFWRASTSHESPGPHPVLWAQLQGCALRRDGLLELGGFDPQFGNSDLAHTDLCFRAWKRGWRVVQAPDSVIHATALSKLCPQHHPTDSDSRNLLLFAWKNFTTPSALWKFQVGLAARLIADSRQRQLNLRPLRFALSELPGLLRLPRRGASLQLLSEEEVFRISSHSRYLRQCGEAPTKAVVASAPSEPGDKKPASARSVETSPLRILLMCPQLPYPPTHGSAVRMWNILKVLATRNRVDVLSFAEPSLSPDQVADSVKALGQYCDRVRIVARRPSYRPGPLDRTVHVEQFDCPEMREALLEMVETAEYDVIQLDKTELGQYLIPGPAPVQILSEHVIFYHAYRRQFLSRGRPSASRLIEYLKLRHYELQACRRFDCVVTMSAVDAHFLQSRLRSHPAIVSSPNGVDTDYYSLPPTRATGNDILFIGNYDHSPNVDGLRFFLKEIFPRVEAAVADVRLFIVGPGPFHLLPEVAAEPQAIATGLVDDTRPYMADCSVFVAPILAGSGTRLKILEAMAAGIPVVTTTVGVEGIEAVDGEHVLIADSERDFADCTVRLLRDIELRERLRVRARALVESRYDWREIGGRLEERWRRLLDVRSAGSLKSDS